MRMLILAILALALTPWAGWSQAPKDSWGNLKQLQPGHRIKVVDKQLISWDGKVVSFSDEAITLQEEQKQQEITVDRANVLRVTDLQHSKRGRNAAIGLAIGCVLGATRGAEGEAYRAVLAGAFGGIGAGVGALVPGHPTIYRAQQSESRARLETDKSSPIVP